jgi:hypothetical protein
MLLMLLLPLLLLPLNPAQVTHKLIDNLKLFHELAGPVFGPGTQVSRLWGVRRNTGGVCVSGRACLWAWRTRGLPCVAFGVLSPLMLLLAVSLDRYIPALHIHSTACLPCCCLMLLLCLHPRNSLHRPPSPPGVSAWACALSLTAPPCHSCHHGCAFGCLLRDSLTTPLD